MSDDLHDVAGRFALWVCSKDQKPDLALFGEVTRALEEAQGKLDRIREDYISWGANGWADRAFVTKVGAILDEGGTPNER